MSNAGRGWGRPSYASKEKQWEAFHRLPRSVRDALNDAVLPYAPYRIWRNWERGRYKNAKELVRVIKRWDRKNIQKALKARKEASSGRCRS